jgi:hypothetical protein
MRCTAAMAMCAASVAALAGILPDAKMPDANFSSSGVRSRRGEGLQHLQSFARRGEITRASLVDDKLRNVDLEIAPPFSPTTLSLSVGGRR